MAPYVPITPDPVAESGVRTATGQRNVMGSFDAFTGGAYAAQLAGPLAVTSTSQWGSPGSADIVSAAVNATAGYGPAGGYAPGAYSGAMSVYGGGPGRAMYGGGNIGMAATNPANDMMTMAQEQLAESQASSLSLLMVQNEMGRQTTSITLVSNAMNSRDNMLASIIRNLRLA